MTSGCPSGSGSHRPPTKCYESITSHTEAPLITEQLVITLNSIQATTGLVWVSIVACANFYHQIHASLHCISRIRVTSASLYLNIDREMGVVLHLPACELQVVFLLPTVMLIGRETFMELETKKECLIIK